MNQCVCSTYVCIDILGIRCQYHCIVFGDSIINKMDNYIHLHENATSQVQCI